MPLAEPGQRGVISTANYPTRNRVAVPCRQRWALNRARISLFARTFFDAYKEASSHIREIFVRHTSLIEPLSLDEAYLDVTHSVHCHGSATHGAGDPPDYF